MNLPPPITPTSSEDRVVTENKRSQQYKRRRAEEFWLMIGIVAVAICVFVVVGVTPFVIPRIISYFGLEGLNAAGVFGDQFGIANALFSGLAFVGVIAALVLQRRELRYQREDSEHTLNSLNKQARFMEEQVTAAREANTARKLIALSEVLQQESFRRDRGILIGLVHKKDFNEWTTDEGQSARRACAMWNVVATLVTEVGVPDSILDSMAYSVTESHKGAEPYLAHVRKNENPHTWEQFTQFAKQLIDRTVQQSTEKPPSH
jgi:hypothetical protein